MSLSQIECNSCVNEHKGWWKLFHPKQIKQNDFCFFVCFVCFKHEMLSETYKFVYKIRWTRWLKCQNSYHRIRSWAREHKIRTVCLSFIYSLLNTRKYVSTINGINNMMERNLLKSQWNCYVSDFVFVFGLITRQFQRCCSSFYNRQKSVYYFCECFFLLLLFYKL